MKYNIFITLKKGVLGFLTGLAAAIIMAVIQAITNYQPSPETPVYVKNLWLLVIPMATGPLVMLSNYLKNRSNQ